MLSHLKYTCLFLFILVASCKEDDPLTNQQQEQQENQEEQTQEPAPVAENNIVPNDFLSGKKYDKLIVEILYISGFQPKAASVDNLQKFLEQRLNKAGGITILQKEIASPGKQAYSLTDLINIEKNNRSQKTNTETLTAYFFFADGDYAGNQGDSKVLGVAYGSSSMAIFEKTVQDYSGGLTQPATSTLESTVIHHEFAHILGLVNNRTPMVTPHQDEAHGKHCNNKDCLMYYAVETTDVLSMLTGGNVPQLDAHCIADLQANGGK